MLPPNKGNITSKSQWGMKDCADKAEGALQRLPSVLYVWTWVRACCQDDFQVSQAYTQQKTSRGLLLHPSSVKLLETGSFLCVAKSGINPDPAEISLRVTSLHIISPLFGSFSIPCFGLSLRKENKILFQIPSLCERVSRFTATISNALNITGSIELNYRVVKLLYSDNAVKHQYLCPRAPWKLS